MKATKQSKVTTYNARKARAEFAQLEKAMANPHFILDGEYTVKRKFVLLIEGGYIKCAFRKDTGEIVPVSKALTAKERRAIVNNGVVLGVDTRVPAWAD